MYIYIYICVFTHIYIYIYVHINKHIHTKTHVSKTLGPSPVAPATLECGWFLCQRRRERLRANSCYFGGFPKFRGTLLGVPIIRTIVFWALYRGTPILGNYHLGLGFRA